MKWTGRVKQIANTRRSRKQGNAEFVEVTVLSSDNKCMLRMRFGLEEAPDIELDDTVEVTTDLQVKMRQQSISYKVVGE
jgi:hypothetical protein